MFKFVFVRVFRPKRYVWSSRALKNLRVCEQEQRYLCHVLFGKHKNVEGIPAKEKKAMWPLGFVLTGLTFRAGE